MILKFISDIKKSGKPCSEYSGIKQYVDTGNIKGTRIIDSEMFSYKKKPSRANVCVEVGDVLFAKMQKSVKVLVIEKDNKDFIYSTGFYCFRDNRILPQYLKYYLLSDYFNCEKDLQCTGGTQRAINDDGMCKISIPVPSISEQKSIVEKLDLITDAIKCEEDRIKLYDEVVKARFVEMFGWPHEKKFVAKILPDIIENDKNALKRGPFGGSLKKDDFVQEGYLVYEQRHAIHNDFQYEKYYITEEKFRDMEMFKVQPKDLLVSCSGTLGRIAEVPQEAKEGIINQALLKITLNQDMMNNTYFMYLFRNQEIQDILFGFSRGSGIPNFPSMSEVKAVEFVCPPIELQNEFVTFVQQVDKQKFEVRKSLENLNQLMQSQLNQYFK